MTELIMVVIGLQLALLVLLALVAVRLRRPAKKSTKASADADIEQQMKNQQAAVLQRLEAETQSSFEQAVAESSKLFRGDLQDTSKKLNMLIVRLTTEVVERELDEYRQSLTAARQQAMTSLQQMQQAVEAKQQELEADVSKEMAARQRFLIERLDKRLGEAVTAYLIESLGQGADLGAQQQYILSQLEAHKAELKKEVQQ